MAGKITRYFVSGHTSRGPVRFLPSAFAGVRRLYLLQGEPGTGKSELIAKAAEEMLRQGRDVELIHSPMDSRLLEGMVVPELGLGIVGVRSADAETFGETGADVRIIDLNAAMSGGSDGPEGLSGETGPEDEAARLQKELDGFLERATAAFRRALAVHDDWERLYIDSMDFAKANELARSLGEAIFAGRSQPKKPVVRHLFLGAATPDGAVDFVENLTGDVKRRIFLKGRPGSGKSTLLKRLLADAEGRGFDADVFHCGFDPGSLDMLIFPELSTAVFDSTKPHEYFPSRAGDETVDMYEKLIRPGTDEKYAEQIAVIERQYREAMREATGHLGEARRRFGRIRERNAAKIDAAAAGRLAAGLLAEIARFGGNAGA